MTERKKEILGPDDYECTHAEIARRLGISRQSVLRIEKRALRKLKKALRYLMEDISHAHADR